MTGHAGYVDLGQYNFTTAADQTGMNPGNITSTFDTGVMKPAKFEMYRLAIGVPSIPSAGQTPMIVQATSGRAASLTTLALTFPATTTKGNLILVGVTGWGDSVNPVVSAVTIGGSADNFAAVAGTSSSASAAASTVFWADPASATAGTAIAITASTGSGTHPNLIGFAWEVSGATTLDVSAVSSNISGTFGAPSLATSLPITTAANDIAFAISGADIEDFVSPPAPSYNGEITEYPSSQGPFTVTSGGYTNSSIFSNAGYGLIPGIQGPSDFVISVSGADAFFTQSVAAFFASTAVPVPAEIPFTVKVGAKTWDINQTVAGVGFTYDPQNTLLLNQGYQMSVLWNNLPSSIYSAYASNFSVSAWFRYDPSLPGNTW